MVATTSSNDGPAGSAQSYMKKIPPHLQGLAIRNMKKTEKDYKNQGGRQEDGDLMAIQAELDADEDDVLDEIDFAMKMLDEVDSSRMSTYDLDAPRMKTYDLDIKDAEVLRNLKDGMHKDDFRRVFGRGVGELL